MIKTFKDKNVLKAFSISAGIISVLTFMGAGACGVFPWHWLNILGCG